MRDPLNRTIAGIAPSGIRKFFDVVSEMPDAISLGVGEPDFDTPWHIREEGIWSLEHGHTHYTSNSGLMSLRREIVRYLDRRFGLRYDAAREVMVTVGGSEAIDIALRAMLDPGDEVLIPQPCYVSYEPCTILAGGVPVPVELKEENDFRLTGPQLAAAVTDRSKVLVLPFPNNPTGSVLTEQDVKEIAQICVERDLFVITDEIYAELTYGGEHHSVASEPGMRERTVYIGGFSKAWAMTGWRLGYACAPERILSQMLKIHQYAIMCAPTTAQEAAVEALKNGDADVAQMRDVYNQRRRYLLHELRGMGLPCFEPLGAFYVFPNISQFGLTSDAFCTRLLREQKLAVVPGTAFGACGEGFVRISYAYSLERLKEALSRIRAFTQQLREEGPHPSGSA